MSQSPPMKLHRLPGCERPGWQVGRTGLQLLHGFHGGWRVTCLSSRHRHEVDWLVKHRLGGAYGIQYIWPTRREALRTISALLAVDPLPEYDAPPTPRKTAPGVWIGPGNLISASQGPGGWQLTAVNPDHAALLPYGPHRGFRTLASLHRLLESAERGLRIDLAHEADIRCEDESCERCIVDYDN